MAKVRNNIITRGLSGKLGKIIVFRQVGDETIVTAAPVRNEYIPSKAQKKQISRFQQAILYAKKALKNESLKASYQMRAKGNRNAFNIAIADFLHPPHIEEIDVRGYDGTKGSRLLVKATDDHKVAGVSVYIIQKDGTMVDHGEAIIHENALDWTYAIRKTHPTLPESSLIIRVSDLAGNVSEKKLVLG